MSFTVEVTAMFGDPEVDFANYPDAVTFDMTEVQLVREVTIDDIVREARGRAFQELPLGVELKTISIDVTKVNL